MTLYFKNVSTDQAWENILNWFTDAAATTQAANAPWVDTVDSTYLAYDLTSATGETSAPILDVAYAGINIGTGATGTADFAGFTNNYGSIYGGTFSGAGFTNSGYIYGGTFSGDGFTNNSNIYGGTFSGDGFTNNSSFNGNIYGGTFSGAGFTNSNYSNIYGGTFSGAGFTNNYGSIYSGTFSGAGFTNSGYIYGGTFSGDGFTNSGNINGYSLNGYGVFFVKSGNLRLQDGTVIRGRFTLASGTIAFDASNGIFLADWGSDILGTGLL